MSMRFPLHIVGLGREDPQDSGHGPIVFTLWMLPLGKIIQEQK